MMETLKFYQSARFIDKYVLGLRPVSNALEFFTARDLILATKGEISGKVYPVYFGKERGLSGTEVQSMIDALCNSKVLQIVEEGSSPKGALWISLELSSIAKRKLLAAKAESQAKFVKPTN